MDRCRNSPACAEPCGRLVELWDESLLKQLSMHERVARVVSLGAPVPLAPLLAIKAGEE